MLGCEQAGGTPSATNTGCFLDRRWPYVGTSREGQASKQPLARDRSTPLLTADSCRAPASFPEAFLPPPPLEDPPPRPLPAPSPLPPRALKDCVPLAAAATAAATPPRPPVDDTAPPRSPRPLPDLPLCVDVAAPVADLLLSPAARPPAPAAPRPVLRLLPPPPALSDRPLVVVVVVVVVVAAGAGAGEGEDAAKLASDFFCAAAKA